MRILTARWVFPVASPPVEDGAVAVRGRRILAVGRRAEVLAAFPEGERWDLGQAAILPGLVNCHTHLEIGPLPSAPAASFVPWLLQVIAHRRAADPDGESRTAEAGVRSLVVSGTTCVGEVSTSGRSLDPVLRSGLRGIVYREILGLAPDEAAARSAAARGDVRAMQEAASGGLVRIGLSPHSPYALSEELFSACAALVQDTGVSPAIHAAESAEEVAFLSCADGPIPRLLYPAVGCASPPARRRADSPIAYLAAQGALAWRPLLIHAVHVDDDDCRLMSRHGVRVAHCPRSNARLSAGVAPVSLLLAHGIPVGLGTDSLASAPTLDLWDEMRYALAVHAGRLDAAAVLSMATLGGARALEVAEDVGSLEVGKAADLVAVAAPHVAAADPARSLLESTRAEDVLLVLIDGAVRHNRTEVVACA